MYKSSSRDQTNALSCESQNVNKTIMSWEDYVCE